MHHKTSCVIFRSPLKVKKDFRDDISGCNLLKESEETMIWYILSGLSLRRPCQMFVPQLSQTNLKKKNQRLTKLRTNFVIPVTAVVQVGLPDIIGFVWQAGRLEMFHAKNLTPFPNLKKLWESLGIHFPETNSSRVPLRVVFLSGHEWRKRARYRNTNWYKKSYQFC